MMRSTILPNNDISRLPVAPLFEKCITRTWTINRLFQIFRRDNRCAEEVAAFGTTVKGGILIIDGPPGSGKSQLARWHAHIFLMTSRQLEDRTLVRNKILIVAPNNSIASQMLDKQVKLSGIARKLQFEHCPGLRDLLIIHYHSFEITWRCFLNSGNRPPPPPCQCHRHPEEEELTINFANFNNQQHIFAFLNIPPDKTIVDSCYSLHKAMRMICGLDQPGGAWDENDKFRVLRSEWYRYNNLREELDLQEYRQMKANAKELAAYCLQLADIVASAPSASADSFIANRNLHFDLILMTEAGRITELVSSHVIGVHHHLGCKIVMEGDSKLRPIFPSSPTDVSVHPQMLRSLQISLMSEGYKTVTLEHNHRFHEELAGIYKNCFQNAKIVTGDRNASQLTNDHQVRLVMKRALGLDKGVHAMLVTVPKAERPIADAACYNEELAVAAIILLEIIVLARFPPDKIGLITPYDDQNNGHVRGVALLKAKHPKFDWDAIWLSTSDNMEGQERAFMIVSLVVSESPESEHEDNTAASALSRASSGMIILAAQEKPKVKGQSMGALCKVITYMTKQDRHVAWDVDTGEFTRIKPVVSGEAN